VKTIGINASNRVASLFVLVDINITPSCFVIFHCFEARLNTRIEYIKYLEKLHLIGLSLPYTVEIFLILKGYLSKKNQI
ncbi:MAG TPA: hypothetical protein PLI20_05995, partial [Bacillota bacterium]|nr:hypothetical protein [Bacillota bacterium]